jgi:hypothetical protein
MILRPLRSRAGASSPHHKKTLPHRYRELKKAVPCQGNGLKKLSDDLANTW